MTLRIAVDIGGTFTDFCIFDENAGEMRVAKAASTPDPIDGLLAGLEQERIDLADVTLFSHGTTVATNALITRRLPRTALVCTEGFRDVIEIRRANKADLWDTYKDVARPYVPRRDRLTVRERVDAAGKLVDRLDEDGASDIARKLKKRGVATVAVCFMNAFANGENERRMKAILQAELPGVPVNISSEVLPEIFEHERFSTTVVNAALTPVAGDYVERLGERLAERGYRNDLLLLHSGGGVMTARGARQLAGRLAGSGIAAGALASRAIALQCGFPNAIGLDMGGTSCDVSLTWEGRSRITKEWGIEFGYPIRFPSIEVLTIGAGGGSLAWIDAGGSLRNGPQSAGANPGPAAYGHGNDVPTNTDAHIVLGHLGPAGLAGGAVSLDPALAETAIDGVADALGMSPRAAAHAILQVADANMADAVRLISIARGHDPREFALVAFGGAGPLHGAQLAAQLSIPTVIVPPNPGVTSALGCLLVDIQHDLGQSFIMPASEADPSYLESAFADLEREAWERMRHESVAERDVLLERSVDMMYRGQWRSLSVPAPSPVTSTDTLVAAFHALHETEYNFRRDGAPVDCYRVNLRAIGVVPKAVFRAHQGDGQMPEPASRRPVCFDGEDVLDTPVYDRAQLTAGLRFAGPAIVEQLDSTTVVPPDTTVDIDGFLNLLIHVKL